MIDQIEHMIDDDEEIKIIFNTLSIKVFPEDGEILDLARIKINKNNKRIK